MARRRRKSKSGKWVGRVLTAVLAVPALYLTAALIGSLIPVNRGWTEPAEGTTIYIADNGIHTDIIMPVEAQGLDWRRLVPQARFAAVDPNAQWIAFGSGEQPSISILPAGTTSGRARSGRRSPAASVSFTSSMSRTPTMLFDRSGSGQRNIDGCGPPIRADFALDRVDGRGGSSTRATARPMHFTRARGEPMRSVPATSGRELAKARRGPDEPLAAVRQRPHLALPRANG